MRSDSVGGDTFRWFSRSILMHFPGYNSKTCATGLCLAATRPDRAVHQDCHVDPPRRLVRPVGRRTLLFRTLRPYRNLGLPAPRPLLGSQRRSKRLHPPFLSQHSNTPTSQRSNVASAESVRGVSGASNPMHPMFGKVVVQHFFKRSLLRHAPFSQ